MRVLYLTDAGPDYLSDDILYGLRAELGDAIVDFPKKDVLYNTSPLKSAAHTLYGAAFHCFGLDDVPIDRTDIPAKIATGYFDVIINSSGWRIRSPLHPQLVVLDGEDHGKLTQRYTGRVAIYFKRELSAPRPGVEPILFALPDFLRDDSVLPRRKQYHSSFRLTSDIRRSLGSMFPPSYSFRTWQDYLRDIKEAWFALSPKGAGYDCQRHYEILGQAVLCLFMDDGAPWLMKQCFVDNRNCLTFASVPELADKIARCRDPQRLIDQARTDALELHLGSRRAAQLLSTIRRAGLQHRKPSWVNRLQWRRFLSRQAVRQARYAP
jgi:hypothetical protein